VSRFINYFWSCQQPETRKKGSQLARLFIIEKQSRIKQEEEEGKQINLCLFVAHEKIHAIMCFKLENVVMKLDT